MAQFSKQWTCGQALRAAGEQLTERRGPQACPHSAQHTQDRKVLLARIEYVMRAARAVPCKVDKEPPTSSLRLLCINRHRNPRGHDTLRQHLSHSEIRHNGHTTVNSWILLAFSRPFVFTTGNLDNTTRPKSFQAPWFT